MKNEAKIADLTRKLGYGSHASHGVKKVLGKMPINMSDARADQVLAELATRYAATDACQARVAAKQVSWGEDAPFFSR